MADRYDEEMILGGKSSLSGLVLGLSALAMVSCANRFDKKKDPLAEYYASRPRYQEPTRPSERPSLTPPVPGAIEPPTPDAPAHGGADQVVEEPAPSTGHGGVTAPSPDVPVVGPVVPLPSAPPSVGGVPRPPLGSSGPVSAHGGGNFRNFGNLEAAQIRENILGKSRIKQFADFEPMVDRMMDLNRGPKDVHTVSAQGASLTKINFDLSDKYFCEDFTLAETKIPSFYGTNRSLKGRWEGPQGKAALAEMQRVNRAHNQILRDYKAAREAKDEAKAKRMNEEHSAYWKTFMSCLAYSESGIFWERADSKRWLSNWNDYGIYQLNPAQKSGGNLNDCVKNWNQEFPQEKIDESRFRSSADYRKAVVTTASQHFNTFCGLSKIHQNLAHQSDKNEGCLNPFKKSYNHFGALMQNSDLNFLRCTSKLIPSPGAPKTTLEAFESFRSSGKTVRAESSASTHD